FIQNIHVEKVIDALEAIFSALLTLVKDLIQFLKFLFSWDDITRTKDVMQNILMMYMDYGVTKLEGVKSEVNNEIAQLEKSINAWASISTDSDEMDNANQPMSYTQSQTDYTGVYTSPNSYLQDHFTNNIANASSSVENTSEVLANLIKESLVDLTKALKDETKNFQMAIDRFQTELFDNDQYKTMSLIEILQTSCAIIADLVLDSVATLIDLVIDFIVTIFESIIDLLSVPIWIPIVSDILEEIFGFEFQFSLLDIICLTCAVPATLIYKLLNQKAPFTEDDGFSTQIINAKDYESLAAVLGKGPETTPDYSKEFDSKFYLPESAKNVIFEAAHILSGTAAAIFGVLVVVEDIAEIPWVPFVSQAKSLSSVIQSYANTAAGTFAEPYPIKDNTVANLSTAISNIGMLSTVIFTLAPLCTKTQATKIALTEIGAGVDIAINLTAIAPVAYHFVELSQTDSNNMRSLAIINETANICNNLSSICADIAKFNPEPTTSVVTAGVSAAIAFLNGGLQIAESIVDNQD
ncbi:hypothetical protein, partial [Flavobacterium araucananum]